jgi:hypothetical protein
MPAHSDHQPTSVVVVLALAFAGTGVACTRPDPLLICHNANCAGPPNPSQDDTIDALRSSLALRHDGRPLLDGVEIDVFWHAAVRRCLFAHDLERADSPEAMEAAQVIASYLGSRDDIAWNGDRFTIRMELKGFVGTSYRDEHTEAQAREHASCALDLLDVFDEAAERESRRLVVVFDSSSPRVLRALTAHERWPGKRRGQRVELRLSADFVDSTPSGLALQKLSSFPPVDDVVFHAGWIDDGHYQAFLSMDVDMTLWMFSATAEAFDAIERLDPDAVLTSEAPLMRRWIED